MWAIKRCVVVFPVLPVTATSGTSCCQRRWKRDARWSGQRIAGLSRSRLSRTQKPRRWTNDPSGLVRAALCPGLGALRITRAAGSGRGVVEDRRSPRPLLLRASDLRVAAARGTVRGCEAIALPGAPPAGRVLEDARVVESALRGI